MKATRRIDASVSAGEPSGDKAAAPRALGLIPILACLALWGCSPKAPAPEPAKPEAGASAPEAPVAKDRRSRKAPPVAISFDPEEKPPEDVVERLERSRYDAIEQAGGMPVTITATGKQLVLRPKLHSVKVEECSKIPQARPGSWMCQLEITVTLKDGEVPTSQGERIGIYREADGEWTLDWQALARKSRSK